MVILNIENLQNIQESTNYLDKTNSDFDKEKVGAKISF
jgi:hypothetical protein